MICICTTLVTNNTCALINNYYWPRVVSKAICFTRNNKDVIRFLKEDAKRIEEEIKRLRQDN